MITDARALRPDFVPQDLYHREGQIDHLSSVLEPSTLSYAENVCIFGPPGVGKTTIAKYTLGQLERERFGIRWAYVSCLSESTTGVLHAAARNADLGADLRRSGTPRSEPLRRLREYDDQIVVILDEVSVLDEESLLALAGVANVSLVCITTDEDHWFSSLSGPATSRMRSAATVHLDKYSHSELCDILDSRLTHGVMSSRVDDDVVPYVADLAAGDARRGIAMLRRGVDHVDRTDTERLTTEVINETADGAEADIRERRIRSLGTHHRLLLRIIEEAGTIDAETLRERYERQADRPKSDSSRKRYLKLLRRYELIERVGSGRGSRYRAVTSAHEQTA
ncbi:Cdc6/Cdc18 family protein [Haloarcula pellucida]|uniref:Cell division control protein Cdc6 n=1 Tax=Haloarcula pellucida TaxID=1427151 RepID=A0A830GKX8_9EURY|nr:AAA family ATPase [Halomicroarcula pellucida]MBX0348668.1 AAA family ATPase [Halomicroarcula pellucida]GGN92300.1 cell division control protein Cdc6 [Halomicroarcula pellucida]